MGHIGETMVICSNLDWTTKPAADVTFNKLFNEWWTEENAMTNNAGVVEFRGFKGRYEITISFNGESLVDTISLIEDTQLNYNIDQSTSTNEEYLNLGIKVFPNPINKLINIECLQKYF